MPTFNKKCHQKSLLRVLAGRLLPLKNYEGDSSVGIEQPRRPVSQPSGGRDRVFLFKSLDLMKFNEYYHSLVMVKDKLKCYKWNYT